MNHGFLITYKSSKKNDITKINHHLFGRTTKIKEKEYNYLGVLENIKYLKICNGCYFVEEKVDNYNDLIQFTKVSIQNEK